MVIGVSARYPDKGADERGWGGCFNMVHRKLLLLLTQKVALGKSLGCCLGIEFCIHFTYRNLYYYVLYIIISGYTLPVGVKPV